MRTVLSCRTLHYLITQGLGWTIFLASNIVKWKIYFSVFKKVFGDTPSCTTCCYHDVDVGTSPSIKQHPYRTNPIKLEQMRKEIDYMLENHIIEPSNSDWSSPSILVPKPDGSLHFCMDFRKLNSLTKTDSFPLPRIENCIDIVGKVKYLTKFDLLKGYWQIPLSPAFFHLRWTISVLCHAIWYEKYTSNISKNDK